MTHSSHVYGRLGSLLAALLAMAGLWIAAAMPVSAQSEATPPASMIDRFLSQPDLAAPLVLPMILALGGTIVLIAFLGWALKRMPEND